MPSFSIPDRRTALAQLAGVGLSGWFGRLASAAATDPTRKRSCILLWMNGGPSTIDLWDLKPGHNNGGPYKEIGTSTPGLKVSEHLPLIAARMKHLAILRSMTTKEGDHGRAAYLTRTGVLPLGGIDFPTFGALAAKELHRDSTDLPPFVSVAPQRFLSQAAYGAGFLGPRYAPLLVADGQSDGRGASAFPALDQILKVQNLDRPSGVSADAAAGRLGLMADLEAGFLASRPGVTTDSHRAAYAAAVRLMNAEAAKAFDLRDEKRELRDKYGATLFGQGCLLARRLVERGVPFVEVTLSGAPNAQAGWDTHANNFDQVKALCQVLDKGWSALLDDLKDRGLLETTTIVWMGEFGRTPKINPQKGRDHFPNVWSAVLGGGGIKGGQAIGKTSADGMTVAERPVSIPDLLATVCGALGIDHEKQNQSNVGRPFRIVDKAGHPIKELLS